LRPGIGKRRQQQCTDRERTDKTPEHAEDDRATGAGACATAPHQSTRLALTSRLALGSNWRHLFEDLLEAEQRMAVVRMGLPKQS
jgi:hypothetical protein